METMAYNWFPLVVGAIILVRSNKINKQPLDLDRADIIEFTDLPKGITQTKS